MKEKNIHQLLQNTFKMEEKEALVLLKNSSPIEWKKGDFVFEAGEKADFVFIVLSGALKLYRLHADGKERIVRFLLPGEVAGAVVAMNQEAYPLSAKTLDYSVVLKIRSGVFQKIFLSHPQLGPQFAKQIAERIQEAHTDSLMVFDSVEKKLAHCILDLLHRFQKRVGPTRRIPLSLTRQDIANRIGASVETVIRVFSEWAKKGLVLTQDKYVEVPHENLLEELVGRED